MSKSEVLLVEPFEKSGRPNLERQFSRRNNSLTIARSATNLQLEVRKTNTLTKTSSTSALGLLDTFATSPCSELDSVSPSLENLCKTVLQPTHSLNESANELVAEPSARVRELALPAFTRVRMSRSTSIYCTPHYEE